jgi:hypothetical protein
MMAFKGSRHERSGQILALGRFFALGRKGRHIIDGVELLHEARGETVPGLA